MIFSPSHPLNRFTIPGKGRRKPLYDLVERAFPTLLQLLQTLHVIKTLEAAEIMKLIIKVYWVAINVLFLPRSLLIDSLECLLA